MLALEIADELEAALEQFAAIAEEEVAARIVNKQRAKAGETKKQPSSKQKTTKRG